MIIKVAITITTNIWHLRCEIETLHFCFEMSPISILNIEQGCPCSMRWIVYQAIFTFVTSLFCHSLEYLIQKCHKALEGLTLVEGAYVVLWCKHNADMVMWFRGM